MLEDFRLKAFETLAKCGSFTAAAKALGVSQPAISQNISELEKMVGTKLFERSRSGVVLTERGEQFHSQASGIIEAYRKMEIDFKAPRTILFRNVLLDGRRRNVLVSDGRFADLDASEPTVADRVVEGNLAIVPSFYNTHTHAAMTLLRGYADDMPLQKWLQEYIWPYEDKLTAEDIRRGSKLALKEMASSGSVFFNDMYFEIDQTIREVDEMGMRAAIGITVMEMHSKAVGEAKMDFVRNFTDPTGGRIKLVIAPHAIYTVGEEKLKTWAAFARKQGLMIHIHLSETRQEVDDCLREHGMTPVRYLDKIGFLGPDVIAAHCVHVDEGEWKILSKRGVTISHCPCSNMKLGSGRFPYELAIKSGCRITLGTDGASSNNSLDMFSEMKAAALLAKVTGDPTLLPAEEIFKWATRNGAEAFGIDAGAIAVGKLADAMLIDLDRPAMQPCHNLISNLVYAADTSCVSAVLCEGRFIFERK